MTLLEDKFLECKVRCENCGEVFTEKGWGIRGVGESYGKGILKSVSGLLSDIFSKK
jgi:hypothetical protein